MRHPLRIQRKRTKGWRKPEGAVSITRPGVFGNPFRTAESFRLWMAGGGVTVSDLHGTVKWGDSGYTKLNERREEILRRMPDLLGKQLMCFCDVGEDCHGDVLAKIANRIAVEGWVSFQLWDDDPDRASDYIRSVFESKIKELGVCVSSIVTVYEHRNERTQACHLKLVADTLPIRFRVPRENGVTLAEYREKLVKIFGEKNSAVRQLDERITIEGSDKIPDEDHEHVWRELTNAALEDK